MNSRGTLYRKSGCSRHKLCKYFSTVPIGTLGRRARKSARVFGNVSPQASPDPVRSTKDVQVPAVHDVRSHVRKPEVGRTSFLKPWKARIDPRSDAQASTVLARRSSVSR